MANTVNPTGCGWCLDGESSHLALETSGVSQSTVLGPLMFLIYDNDIAEVLL